MPDTGIGASVRRKEDQRFLTGKGRYTDDLNRPGQIHAVFVRSPHAHATVASIKTDAAAAAPGVIAVFTGKDMEADGVGSLPCGWTVTDKHGEAHKAPPHFPLGRDKGRYVGDHVAVVLAESAAAATDAACSCVSLAVCSMPPAVALSSVAASPMPLTPSSLEGFGTGLKPTSISGKSLARGMQ